MGNSNNEVHYRIIFILAVDEEPYLYCDECNYKTTKLLRFKHHMKKKHEQNENKELKSAKYPRRCDQCDYIGWNTSKSRKVKKNKGVTVFK